jgi:OOP family OmpA-OmpF porin
VLQADGIAAAAITTKGYGKSAPKIDTAEGVREPMNRRVEISAGGTNQ